MAKSDTRLEPRLLKPVVTQAAKSKVLVSIEKLKWFARIIFVSDKVSFILAAA